MDDDDSDEYGFEYGISVLGGGNVDSGDFIARAELTDEWCGHRGSMTDDLAARLDAIRQLRAMGATTCRVGDVEATFPLAPVRLESPPEAPRRQLNRPHDPDELTPEEMDYVP